MSTGPKTPYGKQQSQRNAIKHGLTAETVIEPLRIRRSEDAIVAEHLPQTPVEQELVHRLASLFWRLRRATSIETGLLRMQTEMLHAFRSSRQNVAMPPAEGSRPASAGSGAEIRRDVVWYAGASGAARRGSIAGHRDQLFAPGQSR